MGTFTGPSISQLPGWRVGCLLLMFLALALGFEAGTSALDRYLKRKGKRALRHVIRRLQAELLVLGLLSLLLVAFESYLLKICIDCTDSCSWDCPEGEAYAPPAPEVAGGGQRRRGMLAAKDPALDAYSCYTASKTCGPGSEPFWSQLAIIQAHIFIFLIALTQILLACATMLLCQWKLRRWRRYEQESLEQELQPLHSRRAGWGGLGQAAGQAWFMPQPGDNPLTHGLRCTALLVTGAVNSQVYRGLRRLFVERLDVDRHFDFHSFLVESMEEELACIIGGSYLLWGIALLWIMLPPAAYSMVWLTGLAVAAWLVVGLKLQAIIIALAQQAFDLYGRDPSAHPSSDARWSIKQRLQRMSPFIGGRSRGDRPLKHSSSSEPDLVAAEASSRSGNKLSGPQSGALIHASSSSQQQLAEQQAEAAEALADSGARLEDAAAVAQMAAKAAAEAAVQPAVRGRLAAPLQGEQEQGEQAQQAQQAQLAAVSQQQQQVEQQLGRELSTDLEAQQQPGLAARFAVEAAAEPHARSSVFRRCCPWALPSLPWHRRQRARRVRQSVQRSKSFSAAYRGPDAAALFWFGRPRLMLWLFQFIYFEISLSVAAVLFSLWQGVNFDWARYGGWPFLVTMIFECMGVELVLLLLTALCVLPVYALTTAAGSHSAASVIKHCLKSGVKPAVARALQRLSMQRPVAAAGEVEAAEQPGGDAGEDEPASAAPQLPHQASWLGPLPLSPLQHTPGFGMPPLLARHSAPLPHLRRLSAGPPIQEASSGELEVSPFAAAAAEGLDPAAVAAAAAAAAMGPEVEVDDDERHGHQRSLTRLMGAMYQRQLQRHLERATSFRRPGSRGSVGASSGGWPDLGSQPSAETAVETCPAAVGARWQQQLARQLDQGDASGEIAAAAESGDAAGTVAPGSVGVCDSQPGSRVSGRPPLPIGSNRAAPRRTLAEVRGLFDAVAAQAEQPQQQQQQ